MSILDPRFKYIPAAATDIRKTFARIRREQKLEQERRRAQSAMPGARITRIATGSR